MHEYELMYILHPRLTADEAAGAIERVGAHIATRGGEVLTAENWGRRRLSYPINHEFEGTYVLTTMRLAPTATATFESDLRISEDVIRHLLIRGIIPYEGPAALDERSRGPRTAASELPEAAEQAVTEATDAPAVEAAAVEPVVAAAAAVEAEAVKPVVAAVPAEDAGGTETGSEAEGADAVDDAGSVA